MPKVLCLNNDAVEQIVHRVDFIEIDFEKVGLDAFGEFLSLFVTYSSGLRVTFANADEEKAKSVAKRNSQTHG